MRNFIKYKEKERKKDVKKIDRCIYKGLKGKFFFKHFDRFNNGPLQSNHQTVDFSAFHPVVRRTRNPITRNNEQGARYNAVKAFPRRL